MSFLTDREDSMFSLITCTTKPSVVDTERCINIISKLFLYLYVQVYVQQSIFSLKGRDVFIFIFFPIWLKGVLIQPVIHGGGSYALLGSDFANSQQARRNLCQYLQFDGKIVSGKVKGALLTRVGCFSECVSLLKTVHFLLLRLYQMQNPFATIDCILKSVVFSLSMDKSTFGKCMCMEH